MKKAFVAETNQEYQEFLNSEGVLPPSSLTEKILTSVRKDLNPNSWFVFSKMALIHFTSGLFTLSICPQFGVSLFGDRVGVTKYFMNLGQYGCIAACGAFFVGISLLLTGLILKREELKRLREHELLQLSAVIFLSLGAFVMADAEILIGFGIAWAIGSLLGGLAMIELSWLIRQRFVGLSS
jgi:hypothetical protein